MSSRRDFFKRLVEPAIKEEKSSSPLYIRPPYVKDYSLFDKECIECEQKSCAKVCEENIIIIEAKGTPILNLQSSGCTFCQECAIACQKGVLSIEEGEEKINATFYINKDLCLSHNKNVCFSCKEPCIDNAILFKGMFEPIIDIEKCTACGFCLSRCPTKAIEFIIK
ncbi:MAG: ferredoxin-type protein NapF [Epsilonproteobacteria bacterium]|nr:ferredoxin-type protein NapF [Campylobacterota bacterium]